MAADVYSCVDRKKSLRLNKFQPHFFKASFNWECDYLLYPDWSCNGHLTREHLSNTSVSEVDENFFIEKKSFQNIHLLKEIDSPSAQFYLAQLYLFLNQTQEAISHYRQCVQADGSIQIKWCACYMLGQCYEDLNDWGSAEYWYLQAYQSDPTRADPLYRLAMYYRKLGQNHLAYLFAKQGASINSIAQADFWIEPAILPYQFDEEISIAAYYTSHREEGELIINDLLLERQVPWSSKSQAYRNLLFYAQKLEEKRSIPITFDIPFIQPGAEERYHPMNPSIRRTENGYQVICRTVNYTQTGAKFFSTSDPTGVFKTRNFLLDYDESFNLLAEKEIIEDLPRKKHRFFNLEGLDDCRIFAFNKGVWFSCNTGDTNPFANFQISLCKLQEEALDSQIKVAKLLPLKGPDLKRCEKNWLPFIKEETLHFIYSYDPLLIYTPNLQTGQCTVFTQYQPYHDFSHFRGSAGPIPFDEGYLVLVHEVALQDDQSRCYLHRFLYLNSDFIVKKISKLFTFNHLGVEYSCSMTLDHSGAQLIIPIGVEDREAYIYFYDCDQIRSCLYPIKDGASHVFSSLYK